MKNKSDQKLETMKVALAQMAPVWLNREQTLEKIISYTERAASEACQLVVFGEALLPGYPFWLERTDGARFNSPIQKDIHAHYLQQAVQIERGDLNSLCRKAAQKSIAIFLGCVERPLDRGGHSLYCTLVYIDQNGIIQPTHRKLMPSYEERLTWAQGDGHGLRVHPLGPFVIGGLNCWENWLPLARAALYAQGENIHVAVWPGCQRNTIDITPFIAKEARAYVISVSGLMRKSDFPDGTPHLDTILANSEDLLANGGSCLAGPDGDWLIEPRIGEEGLFTAVINHQCIRAERQNFDPSGHYARPDVLRLSLNRERQGMLSIDDHI